MPYYVQHKFLTEDPFVTLDEHGVGQLVEIGTKLGRSHNPKLKVGICGEHGGDPRTIEFCHRVGLNYVSCSPFRVPIARLAAAQAALKYGKPGAAAPEKAAKKPARKAPVKKAAKPVKKAAKPAKGAAKKVARPAKNAPVKKAAKKGKR